MRIKNILILRYRNREYLIFFLLIKSNISYSLNFFIICELYIIKLLGSLLLHKRYLLYLKNTN